MVLDVHKKTPRWVKTKESQFGRLSDLKYLPFQVNDVVLFGFMAASFLADFRVNADAEFKCTPSN